MRTINVLFAAMAAFVAASCNKDVRMAVAEAEEPCAPISFKVDGLYPSGATASQEGSSAHLDN